MKDVFADTSWRRTASAIYRAPTDGKSVIRDILLLGEDSGADVKKKLVKKR